jgi:predicted GH43/DUF377 family glycosyl hydrolase
MRLKFLTIFSLAGCQFAFANAANQLVNCINLAAGEALFDPDNPDHLLARMDKPFYKPETSYEKTGQ